MVDTSFISKYDFEAYTKFKFSSSNPAFKVDFELLLKELDSRPNKTWAHYSLDGDFLGIATEPLDDNSFYFKRNAYSVLHMLAFGMSRNEIMDILKISRSYMQLLVPEIRLAAEPLRDYLEDFDRKSSFIVY